MSIEEIKEKTKELVSYICEEADIQMSEAGGAETGHLMISVNEDANLLIGHNGGNLQSLEYLLKKILQKKFGVVPHFILDVNGYRAHQLEELKTEVRSEAKKARLYRKEICLRPMTSFERRVVHMTLAEYPDITTESTGRDPERMVVIKPYP